MDPFDWSEFERGVVFGGVVFGGICALASYLNGYDTATWLFVAIGTGSLLAYLTRYAKAEGHDGH